MRNPRIAVLTLLIAAPLALSGCSGSSSDSATSSDSASATTPMSDSGSMTDSSSSTAEAMAMPFGPGCSAVPASGAGSFDGMLTAPVATAASNNPLLSTLVTAVKSAGLAETLNTTQDITVFAPTNDAFAKVDPATLKSAMADPKGLLTKVLTNHVVPGKLAPDQLAGEHKTLAGTTITVTGSGEDFTVGTAKVVCGNVQTANATVYIIDGVLLPS